MIQDSQPSPEPDHDPDPEREAAYQAYRRQQEKKSRQFVRSMGLKWMGLLQWPETGLPAQDKPQPGTTQGWLFPD